MERFNRMLNRILSFLYVLIMLLMLFLVTGDNHLEYISEEHLKNYNYIENIYIRKGIDNTYLTLVNNALNIDEKLYQKFIEDNGYVIITDNINNERVLPSIEKKAAGTFIRGNNFKRICILAENSHDITSTVLHELGHYLDYSLGYASKSFEFKKLFNKYKDIDLNNYDKQENFEYIRGNISEFYAERYSDYILYPSILKEYEPEIFDYFEDAHRRATE
jgi:hypothetical protein